MKKLLINLSILIIVAIFSFWIFLIEPNFIKKTNLTIILDNVSKEAEMLKMVQISDIHFKGFNTIPRKTEEELIRLKPDYLFITGDIVNWDLKKIEDLKDFLNKITEIKDTKIFGVFGNHEHLSKKYNTIKDILLSSKIRFLNNESTVLPEGINLVGLDDPHLGLSDIGILKGIDESLPTIVLAHSPEIFSDINIKNALVLSGHSHGGQINIPIISEPFLPLTKNRNYKKGLFQDGDKQLYVNRGLGTTFLPIRFNSFPEIMIFHLSSK